jgi:asparagine synthase (glutamine-hydrolysing)
VLPPVHESLKKRKRISALRDLIDCYVYAFSIFLDHDKQRLFRSLARELNTYDFFREHYPLTERNTDDPIDTMCTCDLINYIGNHHVYRTDQFTMWFSLEARFPFLDHELVELAFRMPSELKVAHGTGKYILRQVARDYIAPACLEMGKKGFSMPVGEWIRGAMKPLVSDRLSRLGKRDIFSRHAIDDIVREYYARRRSALQVWLLVSVEMWLERFIDGHRHLRAELTRARPYPSGC